MDTFFVLDNPVPNPKPDKRYIDNIRTNVEWEPGLWIVTDGEITTYRRYATYGRLNDGDLGTARLHRELRPLNDTDPAEFHVSACMLKIFGRGTLYSARKDMLAELYLTRGIGAVEHLAAAVKIKWDKEISDG